MVCACVHACVCVCMCVCRERSAREQQIQSKLQQLEEAEEVWRRTTEEQWREVRCGSSGGR